MAGWTKDDYDAAYSIRVSRHFGGDPNQIRCNYHKWAIQPILQNMWGRLTPILNIASSEHICVVGAGFGWGVEAVIAETGATVVGIDISEYIAAEQASTETAELRAAITAAGHDPDSGHGAVVLAGIDDGQPRANVIVLENDASSGPQRNEIRTALGGNWPSVVVYEDIIDDTMTDQDILNARNAGNGFGGAQRLIFIARPTAARSLADIQTITLGAEVISPDGGEYLP